MSDSVDAEADEKSSYGDGRRHVLFAFSTQVPVLKAGHDDRRERDHEDDEDDEDDEDETDIP